MYSHGTNVRGVLPSRTPHNNGLDLRLDWAMIVYKVMNYVGTAYLVMVGTPSCK